MYDNAKMTNDFYILSDDNIFPFMSYYVIDNQWGIRRTTVSHTPKEKYQIKSNRAYPGNNECNDAICCKEG